MKRILLIVLMCFLILSAATLSEAEERKPTRIHHSSDFGWKPDQDVTEAFQQLLESGKLKPGDEMRLQHTYRIAGSLGIADQS